MRGLGQAKWIPGQVSFSSLPAGREGLPSLQPLVERGLPIAPYIEHGSYETGAPAIMRYARDPYRGIMGLDAASYSGHARGRSNSMSEGLTIGQSVRRLEDQNYIIACSDWRQNPTGGGVVVTGMREAMRTAKRRIQRLPYGAVCRAFLPSSGPVFVPGTEVFALSQKPSGELDVRFNYSLRGMGGALTEFACSETQAGQMLSENVNLALRSGLQASVVGAAVGGLIGGASRQPVIGIIGGVISGYLSHMLWTAPYRR